MSGLTFLGWIKACFILSWLEILPDIERNVFTKNVSKIQGTYQGNFSLLVGGNMHFIWMCGSDWEAIVASAYNNQDFFKK